MSTDQELAEKFIHYRTGDATDPVGPGRKIIAHITNNLGGWGAGFVVPLAKRYPASKNCYLEWAEQGQHRSASWLTDFPPFELGFTQFVICSPRVVVANMTAQNGYARPNNPHPCDLVATTTCLAEVFSYANQKQASIHMPRIGCGLGGATWDEILECIWDARVIAGGPAPNIMVYDFA